MKNYLKRRLLQFLPVVLGICILNFVLIRLAPGDMAEVMAGETGMSDSAADAGQQVEHLRESFGLNIPAHEQLFLYLKKLLSFDLGYSYRFNAPVSELIAERVGATALLGLTSLLLAVAGGVLLGVLCARWRNGRLDRAVSALMALCYSVPVFWLALMLVVLFGVTLQWFPIGGMQEVGVEAGGRWALARDIAWHLVLPVSTLAVYSLAVYTRFTRASMVDTLQEDYIRTARSKGLSDRVIYFRHALRNAILPVLTMIAANFGELLAGSIVIETVFSWPGLGKLTYDAVLNRDTNLLLSILFLSSLLVMATSVVLDILYAKLDPRIELQS
ncbi:peptide/nickel transport system permease protein [Pseudoduganella lurida]|uniref:Peptide/nickel transport system permease protein n=1 Tax=Pseudoduganella lurida TaxID=1036180 RepID=A0A562RE56_9BURK|nr:ABC transporter permease [Pseudoduganella lurida]TWI67345.1 peptide/nickel transport system permease protein [Pseudoduganella lurida]